MTRTLVESFGSMATLTNFCYRFIEDTLEFKFETVTVGAQYHVNKKTRINLEIANRDFEAINFGPPPGAGNPNNNLDGVDTRYAIQLTHIF